MYKLMTKGLTALHVLFLCCRGCAATSALWTPSDQTCVVIVGPYVQMYTLHHQ